MYLRTSHSCLKTCMKTLFSAWAWTGQSVTSINVVSPCLTRRHSRYCAPARPCCSYLPDSSLPGSKDIIWLVRQTQCTTTSSLVRQTQCTISIPLVLQPNNALGAGNVMAAPLLPLLRTQRAAAYPAWDSRGHKACAPTTTSQPTSSAPRPAIGLVHCLSSSRHSAHHTAHDQRMLCHMAYGGGCDDHKTHPRAHHESCC